MSGRLTLRGEYPGTTIGWPRPASWLDGLRRTLEAVRTRRILSDLDPRLLKDIGISRADAMREAARAPWDLAPPPRRGR
jgi:uncharacterized protein YjiS (DUF1127 family)